MTIKWIPIAIVNCLGRCRTESQSALQLWETNYLSLLYRSCCVSSHPAFPVSQPTPCSPTPKPVWNRPVCRPVSRAESTSVLPSSVLSTSASARHCTVGSSTCSPATGTAGSCELDTLAHNKTETSLCMPAYNFYTMPLNITKFEIQSIWNCVFWTPVSDAFTTEAQSHWSSGVRANNNIGWTLVYCAFTIYYIMHVEYQNFYWDV